MENYNDNELSQKYIIWRIGNGQTDRVKAAEKELTEQRQKRKEEQEKERRRQQAKTHPVEVELTNKQSEKMLYAAFKPSKKTLFAKW